MVIFSLYIKILLIARNIFERVAEGHYIFLGGSGILEIKNNPVTT